MYLFILKIRELLRRAQALAIPDTYREMSACDVLVCCADGDRTDNIDGLAYSRFADGLVEEIIKVGGAVQTYALPYARLVGRKSWSHAHSANRFFFLSSIVGRLRRTFFLRPFVRERAIDFYSRLLIRTGATTIAGIGLPPEAIRAARAQGAKSVEILHGYGYPTIPWGWDVAPRDELPDMVLAFDEVSVKALEALRGKGVTVCAVENYWYRKFLNDAEFSRLPATWREYSWLPKGRKIILVTLSWGYAGDHGPYTYFEGVLKNGLFPEQLLSVIEKSGDEYYWIFRLHPAQLVSARFKSHKRLLDELCRKFENCEWVQGTKAPLPSLLTHCHAHISMISMAAYDAAFMGIPSLMLCPTLAVGKPNESMFRDLEMQGYVSRGNMDASRILDWLQTIASPLAPFRAYTGDKNFNYLELLSDSGRECMSS